MMNVDTTEEFTPIISMCSGMRGLERGIERVLPNVRTVCHVEIEAFVIENLVSEMEAGVVAPAPIFSDLKQFPAQLFRGKICGIVAGFLCQPFSVAGLQKGKDDPRHLWPYIKDHIHAIRPLFFFGENVPGLLNIGYETVRRELQEMGYHVEEGIYSAEEVGAPHKRERMFILAIRSGVLLEHPASGRAGELQDAPSERQGHVATGTGGVFTGTKSVGVNLVNSDRIRQHNVEEKYWKSDPDQIRKFPLTEQPGHDQQCGVVQPGSPGPERKRAADVGFDVADIGCTRLQGHARDVKRTGWQGAGKDRSTSESSLSLWPARPSEKQHNWECPRVESKMGVTIDGYNFREDLLRMAGNGVVEQTAEIAFLDLIQKHIAHETRISPK